MAGGVTLVMAFGLLLVGGMLMVSGIQDRSLKELLKGVTSHHQKGEQTETEAEHGETPASSSMAATAGVSGGVSAGGTMAPAPNEITVKTSGETAKVAKTLRNYFQNRGYSKAAAAGIVGNLQQESSLEFNAPGGGLDQGQGARSGQGLSAIKQLEKIVHELNTSEVHTKTALRRSRTPEEAARIFSERFERPGLPDLANRERYAREAYAG